MRVRFDYGMYVLYVHLDDTSVYRDGKKIISPPPEVFGIPGLLSSTGVPHSARMTVFFCPSLILRRRLGRRLEGCSLAHTSRRSAFGLAPQHEAVDLGFFNDAGRGLRFLRFRFAPL